MNEDLNVGFDELTGQINSIELYGIEMLDQVKPNNGEMYVNNIPLEMRVKTNTYFGSTHRIIMKGERFVDHFTGWGLVLTREMGIRSYMKYNCFGIGYFLRREEADTTCPCPGPGGPAVEAPLWVDTISLMNLNWKFWDQDTKMIFPSMHSNGPSDEFGHIGYEHDTPENCKRFMKNDWRRIYPGVMAIHGGLYYNHETGHWIAITCRKANVGYMLNIENAGRGVSYDFKLHSMFNLGESLRMPEVKIYYGKTYDEMMRWLADYVTLYYQQPPEWVFKKLWTIGLCWDNKPTWKEQADSWEEQIKDNQFNSIRQCLVTNRHIDSGTGPIGYEPDPNHGSIEEFKNMCLRMSKIGVPVIIWMSHSGLVPGSPDIDDDWFIRGIDGKLCAAWGSEDGGMMHINPGHPGYIEYTKKWVKFYIEECGAKGIFLDCLGWAFPSDFKKRSFMRYPGDTNIMAVKFVNEVYNCIKECDSEGILMGEGTSTDFPVNIITQYANPVRAIDGMGPRDFFLQLNKYSQKRIVIDQGPYLFPSSGLCTRALGPEYEEVNRYMLKLLEDNGGSHSFTHMVGDLSVINDLLIVPQFEDDTFYPCVRLTQGYEDVYLLQNEIDNSIKYEKIEIKGGFENVRAGIYKMVRK